MLLHNHAWRQVRFAVPGMFAWAYETTRGETMGVNVAGHMEPNALTSGPES